MPTKKLIIAMQIKKIIDANTNIIRKRKNNVNSVNEESICNNNVNKLKPD